LLLTAIASLHYFFRPEAFNWVTGSILIILLIALFIFPRRVSKSLLWRLGISSVLVSFIINLYLNLAFYPSLLKYQALSEAAFWLNKNNPTRLPVAQVNDVPPFAMEFYLDQPLNDIGPYGTGPLPPKPFYLLTTNDLLNNLKAKGWQA